MRKFYLALPVVISFVLVILWAAFFVAQATGKTEKAASSNPIPKADAHSPSFPPFGKDERTQRIFKQEAIIDEGNRLVERGLYDAAIAKFQKALAPTVLNEERDKGNGIYYIEKVYKLQGKFEQAHEQLQWFIDQNPTGTGWLDERLELLALIQSRDTGSPEPLYNHIQYLREKYLSPKGFRGDADTAVSTIIRLYDYIGGYDQGIALVNEILAYGLRQTPQVLAESEAMTAQQVLLKFQELQKQRNAEWHEYKFAYEYLKLRESFLEDKKGNRPSCIGKSGVCMGRATKALIESDYFPW